MNGVKRIPLTCYCQPASRFRDDLVYFDSFSQVFRVGLGFHLVLLIFLFDFAIEIYIYIYI